MKLSKQQTIRRGLAVGVLSIAAVVGVASTVMQPRVAKADAINDTDFVFTVDSTKPGSANNQFVIPVVGGSVYDYTVDCDNDGIAEAVGQTGSYTCTFDAPGVHTVRIGGTFPHMQVKAGGDQQKMLSIDQWGTQKWTSFEEAFSGAENMDVRATDTPDLSNVRSLQDMFRSNYALKGEAANWNWNTSTIESMGNMFMSASQFDQNIGSWDTGNLTRAGHMFTDATVFNNGGDPSIANWNMSKIQYTDSMFERATSFNQPIGKWNMTSATHMKHMLSGATAFDQSLAGWHLASLVDIPGDQWSGGANMLDNSGISMENYDATLIAWNNQVLKSPTTLGSVGLKYCLANNAHIVMTRGVGDGGHGWTINGDAKDCPTHTVAFDSQEGSLVPDQTVAYGDKIQEPAVPTRDGYTFDGWYADAGYANRWDFATGTMPNAGFILYAKWTATPATTPTPPAPTPAPAPAPAPVPGTPEAAPAAQAQGLADTGEGILPLVAGALLVTAAGVALIVRQKRA